MRAEEVTTLLDAMRSGDDEARGRLVNLVVDELRQVAGNYMRGENPDHTLQPTALVNEAFVRMLQQDILPEVQNRRHFFAAAATAMRCILVDHARKRRSEKRGGDNKREPLDEAMDYFTQHELDVEAVHEVLEQLQTLNPRHRQVIDLRFFGGFSMPEIADLLEVSLSTVESDFRRASAFLRSRLQESP